jgi:hypothetical protein
VVRGLARAAGAGAHREVGDADLRGADLRVANLEGARLVGADLRGALFYGSKLAGAILDWRWNDVPVELLRQELAGEGARGIMIDTTADDAERPFAWLKRLLAQGLKARPALRALARHLHPDDNAPELLRGLAADAPPVAGGEAALEGPGFDVEPAGPAPSASPMLWTRRRAAREQPIIRKFG